MNSTDNSPSIANQTAWEGLYASTRDLVWGSEPVGFLRDFIQPEVEAKRCFRRVLDAATGEGRNLPFLLGLAGEVSACDSSEAALGKIPPELRSRVKIARCDLARSPFADSSFDFILLCDTVETLPDPVPVLNELRRILAPGGTLMCNIPGPEGDVAGIEMTPIAGSGYLYRGRFYFRFFKDHEAEELLANCGWEIVRSQTMTWTEAAHPGFRAVPHHHCSRVYLLAPSVSREG